MAVLSGFVEYLFELLLVDHFEQHFKWIFITQLWQHALQDAPSNRLHFL